MPPILQISSKKNLQFKRQQKASGTWPILIFYKSHFQFEGKFYKQIRRVLTGSHMAGIFAERVLGHVEEKNE